MDSLMIPPNPNWFMQAVCHCTPDNGLIYGAMTKIVYIPPKSEAASKAIRVIDLKNKLCCFAINPDWKESKLVAVMNGDYNVFVYDFTSGSVVKGHKGHATDSNPLKDHQASKAIAFLRQNVILSSVNSNLINYCVASNTFKIFLDFSTRNPMTIMKQSPKDQNLVAAGTKNGLVLLISVEKMEVVSKLRGHDTEISSLDWMYLSMKASKEAAMEKDSKCSLEKLIASTDTYDCFDIYEDSNDQEFGVYNRSIEQKSDDEEANVGDMQEKIVSNSNFNFLEACSSLKSQILDDESMKVDSPKGTYEENKDQYGVKNLENPSLDESLESNASSRTPVLTEESLNFLDECQRMKDFVIVTKEEIAQIDEIPVLASGSREQIAWLWDVNERTSFSKIKWHPKSRTVLPSAFTNVLWIDQNTLLVTDANGDINEYKISLDVNTRALTFKEQKDKKFDAKGVLSMCKSDDSALIWTSSIHRHISCLNVAKEYEKIISLDTIQLRIHYIAENPIDSNVIAIGGNDKRICLWNTSEASQSVINLRPFMNKIQAGVLCLSWHPEKDNVLAFSTREGRICVLDVNKSSNVPTILANFSSQEVYSIAWAKMSINGSESLILIACNGHKLGYYNQKDQWKLKIVDHLKHSASVAVSGKVAAIGNGNGDLLIVDLSKNFQVLTTKKICKKYIGMMTWQNNMLAISSETGITLIKNIDENISAISDDQMIKLQGHKGRVFSVRFNKSGSLLVSSCISGYIKVWDVETLLPISSYCIETSAYSAIFLPSNEEIIVCGGQDSTILTYEWRKYPNEQETSELNVKKKLQQTAKKIQWASPTEVTTISKNSQRRHKKKIAKPFDDDVSELSAEIIKMNLHPKKVTTIFHLANREMSTSSLEFIERLLSAEDRELTINEKLFEDRDTIKDAIEKELEQSKQNLKNVGGVILPQLSDTLKLDIVERINNKTLTEVHVAVAPSVSFDLWRKCCVAYGTQCIENEDSLASIPYFLAVNDVESCVNHLCEGKFFREAWVIAKMRKENSDPIFDVIINKWMAYYEYSGNYEAGAALLVCKKDFKKAAEMLDKRQNKTEKCTAILAMLLSKTA